MDPLSSCLPELTRTAIAVVFATALVTCPATSTAGATGAAARTVWQSDRAAPGRHGATPILTLTSTPTTEASRSALVQETITAATSMVGRFPYSWGGGDLTGATLGTCCSATGSDGRNIVGFDCSGLMEYAFFQGAGLRLSSTSRSQYADGPRVPIGRLEAGDMLFWSDSTLSTSGIHHVALYLGNNRIVESVRSIGPRVRSFSTGDAGVMPSVVRPIR